MCVSERVCESVCVCMCMCKDEKEKNFDNCLFFLLSFPIPRNRVTNPLQLLCGDISLLKNEVSLFDHRTCYIAVRSNQVSVVNVTEREREREREREKSRERERGGRGLKGVQAAVHCEFERLDIRVDFIAPEIALTQIPHLENVRITNQIGQGGYGNVYRGRRHADHFNYYF